MQISSNPSFSPTESLSWTNPGLVVLDSLTPEPPSSLSHSPPKAPVLAFCLSGFSPTPLAPLWPCVTPSSTSSLSPGLAHSSQSFVLLRLAPPCLCVREASEGWWDRRQRKKRIQLITHDAFYFDTLSFDWVDLRALSFVFLMYCLLWKTQLNIQKVWLGCNLVNTPFWLLACLDWAGPVS